MGGLGTGVNGMGIFSNKQGHTVDGNQKSG